jgi:hypothetical protein
MQKHRTLRVSKAEASGIYTVYAFMLETTPDLHPGLPNAAEINGWRHATLAETRRRAHEIASGPDEFVTVEMLDRYPRDMVNFYNRLAGEPEE